MKNKKGFTLIELLAVIVILGLLMAIAIPSVTKYINESRKETTATTIGGYIGAIVNSVNDLTYSFTGTNTIYAVPIECVALERGGDDPFGDWHQANDNYWAYVLVQYDDVNSSYTYGFTFKDSLGYGLYPITQDKLNTQGKQIKTGLSLKRPASGKITNITASDNWNGFNVNDSTNLVVLEAESEGVAGDGITTCTLYQKGNNYEQVEEEKKARPKPLTQLILKHNKIIKNTPTLTTTSNISGDESGLYSSNATTNKKTTYYFRGNVTNNYVSFADFTWKIIRINEDGTIRLILNDRVEGKTHQFNSSSSNYEDMYYSNSDSAKALVDDWYQRNIFSKYDSYVANGIFCEQAKVKYKANYTSGNITMAAPKEYKPNFECDVNSLLKNADETLAKVGLITIDEALYAGGYYGINNTEYYLYNGNYSIWTMSPAGIDSTVSKIWNVTTLAYLVGNDAINKRALRPVINLNADVLATGTGDIEDPYKIAIN